MDSNELKLNSDGVRYLPAQRASDASWWEESEPKHHEEGVGKEAGSGIAWYVETHRG